MCFYHNSCEQTHSLATVGVRHHVSISNGEEGDGDEPHGTQKITGHILSIMVPEREIKKQRFSLERFDFESNFEQGSGCGRYGEAITGCEIGTSKFSHQIISSVSIP